MPDKLTRNKVHSLDPSLSRNTNKSSQSNALTNKSPTDTTRGVFAWGQNRDGELSLAEGFSSE